MNIDIKITEFHWSNLPGWPTRALLWKQHILSRDSRAASASVTKKNRFLEFPAKHNNIQHPFPTTSNYRQRIRLVHIYISELLSEPLINTATSWGRTGHSTVRRFKDPTPVPTSSLPAPSRPACTSNALGSLCCPLDVGYRDCWGWNEWTLLTYYGGLPPK